MCKSEKKFLYVFTLNLATISGASFSEEIEKVPLSESEPESESERKSRELELRSIELIEGSDPCAPLPESVTTQALALLDQAIHLAPHHPSPYNNKAQLLRLIRRDEEALNCLNKSITLSLSSSNHHPQKYHSILQKAYAQRAWIHFKCSRNDAAFADFESAAKLGCGESRQMAIRCNPYAAMCNQMLHELIGKTYFSNSK